MCSNFANGSPLHYRHLDTVILLKEGGAALEVEDDYGNTALMHAAANGHAEVVAWLMQAGANIRVRNRFGRAAKHLARDLGHDDVVTEGARARRSY